MFSLLSLLKIRSVIWRAPAADGEKTTAKVVEAFRARVALMPAVLIAKSYLLNPDLVSQRRVRLAPRSSSSRSGAARMSSSVSAGFAGAGAGARAS